MLLKVSAYGFMTPDYKNYSDHYYDSTYHSVGFYINHDLRMEMTLWQQLHQAGLIRLYMHKWIHVDQKWHHHVCTRRERGNRENDDLPPPPGLKMTLMNGARKWQAFSFQGFIFLNDSCCDGSAMRLSFIYQVFFSFKITFNSSRKHVFWWFVSQNISRHGG